MSVKTGLIGAGAFGANHAGKLASVPDSDFQGVFDADRARAEAIASRAGGRAFGALEDLLAAVDAVIVATPARTHAAIAGAALAMGKHVLVEKPLAATAAEANALVSAAQARGLVIQAGHQERFVLEALGLFAAPEPPLRADIVRETSFTGRGMDVSVTLDLMIHDLDLIVLLFGAAPRQIAARGRKAHGTEWDEVDAEIVFPTGRARLRASRMAEARRRSLRVAYPSGGVEIDMLTHALKNDARFALDPDFAAKAADPLGRGVAAFIEAIVRGTPSAIPGVAAFIEAIVRGTPSAIPGESGAAAVALAEAVDRACVPID